jgi:hypothetical protein
MGVRERPNIVPLEHLIQQDRHNIVLANGVYQHISHKLLGMVLEVERYDGQTDAMYIH